MSVRKIFHRFHVRYFNSINNLIYINVLSKDITSCDYSYLYICLIVETLNKQKFCLDDVTSY